MNTNIKRNFQICISVPLINPAKNKLGRISKIIFEKINLIFETQPKSINEKKTNIFNWFKNIKSKQIYKFIWFVITYFDPTITENFYQMLKLCWKIYKFLNMKSISYFIRENCHYLTKEISEWKKGGVYLI